MLWIIRSLSQLFHEVDVPAPQFSVTGTTIRKGAEFWKIMQDDVCILMVHVKGGQIRYKGNAQLCLALRTTLLANMARDCKQDLLIDEVLIWHQSAPIDVASYEAAEVKSL